MYIIVSMTSDMLVCSSMETKILYSNVSQSLYSLQIPSVEELIKENDGTGIFVSRSIKYTQNTCTPLQTQNTGEYICIYSMHVMVHDFDFLLSDPCQ